MYRNIADELLVESQYPSANTSVMDFVISIKHFWQSISPGSGEVFCYHTLTAELRVYGHVYHGVYPDPRHLKLCCNTTSNIEVSSFKLLCGL